MPESPVIQNLNRTVFKAITSAEMRFRLAASVAALVASKEIILCEALIDALTFWCAGYRHVTASYGINGFTDDHRAALRKHGTKRIYIAYDRDDAGERAAQSVAEELLAMGMECFRVQLPKGMDANEYALKVQPAAKSLWIVLNKAEWLGKGQRPTASEPVSAIAEQTAAKEKITEPIEANTEERNDLPLAAEFAPLPPAVSPTSDVPVAVNGEEITITQGDRRYRVLGLEKNTSLGILRVNVLVTRGESLHVDTFDLYSSRHRMLYAKQAGEELGVKEEVMGRDLGRVLLKLEELQRRQIKQALEPGEKKIEMTMQEKEAALGLLEDPRLLERILADFERCGVVGEETNKKVSYLAAVSRLLPAPLAVVVQFRWLVRNHHILHNPASDLDMPKIEKRLPRAVLSEEEAERVLLQPDIYDPLGLRDRAIMETLYSTGIRRTELVNLKLYNLDRERGTLSIWQGKGKKDRIIPIGERAVAWVEKYLRESRPRLAIEPDDGTVFVSSEGGAFHPDRLSMLVREHVEKANIGKKGACHMFRHTMATLMLDGGADIRFIQEMLGHSDLQSTQVYTQVAIRKLKQIHTATHPGASLEKKKAAAGIATQEEEQRKVALLEALGSEADEEKESEE